MAPPNPAATASWPTPRWVVPRTRPSKNNSWARTSNLRHSTIVRYRRRSSSGSLVASTGSVRERVDVMPASVRVGDEELLRGEAGDHLGAIGRHDDLLLDPCRRVPVLRGAVRLEGDHHPLLDLDGVVD